MSLFCYISLGWAVNGIIWNIGAYDVQWRKQEGRSFPQPSSNDMCSLPGGQPSHEYCHFRLCTLPAASTSVIPTVAFNDSVTGQCWQDFSYLGSKTRQKQLHDEWIRAASYLSLKGNAFLPPFSSDKWGWKKAGMTLWEERWIKGFPFVSINTKCCFDICYPLGEQNWSCRKIITAGSGSLAHALQPKVAKLLLYAFGAGTRTPGGDGDVSADVFCSCLPAGELLTVCFLLLPDSFLGCPPHPISFLPVNLSAALCLSHLPLRSLGSKLTLSPLPSCIGNLAQVPPPPFQISC